MGDLGPGATGPCWARFDKIFNFQFKTTKIYLKMNFEGVDVPKSIDEFEVFWHNAPVSQGFTGTCWDFSTTSFFESEIYRLRGEKIKLSEIYTAYWDFVEKARRFIKKRAKLARSS